MWRKLRNMAILLGFAGAVTLLAWQQMQPAPLPSDAQTASGAFPPCTKARSGNCVLDGDTFILNGAHIRIADIDAPELYPPRCLAEADLGLKASARLSAWLSAAPFVLSPNASLKTDKYGRSLMRVTRGDSSISEILAREGLAHRSARGQTAKWC